MLPNTKTFKELFAWQKAHQFVLKMYATTASFPREEVYGLTHNYAERRFQYPQTLRKDMQKEDWQTKKGFLI